MFSKVLKEDMTVDLLLLLPVTTEVRVGSFVFFMMGILMEQSSGSRQTSAWALNMYTCSSVIGLTLNLCSKHEKKRSSLKIFSAE